MGPRRSTDHCSRGLLVRGHFEVVQLLVDSGIDVNVPDQCGRTVLSHVTMLSVDTPRMVELLLSARAIVNWTDSYCNTPLIYACENGHVKEVRHLLAAKACATHEGQYGSPLCLVSEKWFSEIEQLLITAGAED